MAKGKTKKASGKGYKKTMICIAESNNKGKTKTALEVINKLKKLPNVTVITTYTPPRGKHHYYTILKIKGMIIVVDSVGDPKTGFEQRIIKHITSYKCEAIVCTSRKTGSTFAAAKKAAAKNKMLFLKTSTYQPDDKAQESVMNEWKAEHIMDLLKKRKHI